MAVEPQATLAGIEVPAGAELMVQVDVDNFFLEVWDVAEGRPPARLGWCDCAVGRDGYDTPTSTFYVSGRSRWPAWRAPDDAEPPLKPNKVYRWWSRHNPYRRGGGLVAIMGGDPDTGEPLEGYALHGIRPEWIGSIPGRASRGCIRLRKPDIKWLMKHLPHGALVVIQ